MSIDDVPNRVNFHDPKEAKEWIERTTTKRPWREGFFNRFAQALNQRFDRPISILELGSGPGFLAHKILSNCAVKSYVALDFSAAMRELARERLEPFLERVNLVQRDFRSPGWMDALGPYDAIVTMQAVHEVRHKRRIPAVLAQLHGLLAENGLLLICDHYWEPNVPAKDANLYLKREELPVALRDANCAEIECLLDEGGMALYAATRAANAG